MEKYLQTKILIIEDELITAKSIEKSLLDFGFRHIDIAGNYGEGYEKATNTTPGLILMDIKLEEDQNNLESFHDGVSLSERIQTKFNVPIVFLTAHADSQTVSRAYHTSPYGYLVKPYADKDLHNTIRLALNRFYLSPH